MTTANSTTPSGAAQRSTFVTTHWSVVLSARDHQSPQSMAALEKLCRAYWYPLYAYLRRTGQSKENAEDLTQAFFSRLLEKRYLDAAEHERGRFRSFLLVALKRFMANEWDRAHALKRGGFQLQVPLDTELAEKKFAADLAAPEVSPDQEFERRWTLTLLEKTMSRLRAEFQAAGKLAEFNRLKLFLTAARSEIPSADVAAEL
ncbi:MAG TPA: sigma-70 family RNA polymerase sigma factor, partial [Verrucomicrobiae bacterium]|nr:sigma-70 family RNA polymerase sigma factor [Verrucomicrobiae bacterium]